MGAGGEWIKYLTSRRKKEILCKVYSDTPIPKSIQCNEDCSSGQHDISMDLEVFIAILKTKSLLYVLLPNHPS